MKRPGPKEKKEVADDKALIETEITAPAIIAC